MNVQALKAFRANVKAILARRGLSLRDAAEAAGMGYPYLHSILSGKSNPSLMVAEKLANSLGVPLAELIQDKIPQPT
jgi:transcriptional regulator with XRE-family HTH domain